MAEGEAFLVPIVFHVASTTLVSSFFSMFNTSVNNMQFYLVSRRDHINNVYYSNIQRSNLQPMTEFATTSLNPTFPPKYPSRADFLHACVIVRFHRLH